MAIKKDEAKIDQLLTRGVENVYPSKDALHAALKSGKRLTFYLGIDPTGPTLHLGHAIPMRKLRELQDLGHKIVLLIGDFTAMIGDPTDKGAARKRLTRKEVLANAKDYKKQAGKILNFSGTNKVEWKFNSKWLAKLNFEETVELCAHFTVQQMLERDMFERRIAEQKPIHLHEFLYPLMQAYDSVAMGVDGEVGGNDQTFNMLAGRTLIREMAKKDKFVIATKLLVDSGGKKMGKTEGNMVTLADSADEMFGKVMSWTDGMIVPGFDLLTSVPTSEIADLKAQMERGINPRDIKARLAGELVRAFHGDDAAVKAATKFDQTFRAHEAPKDVRSFAFPSGTSITNILTGTAMVTSGSEARRIIEQGGVKVDGEVIHDAAAKIYPKADGSLLQKGKRHFVKIVKG
jgi:tyrosyl-tRNA synthetase